MNTGLSSVLKIVRGLVKLVGDTDNTAIGNVGDRLKVDAALSSSSGGLPAANRVDVNQTITATGNSSAIDADGFGSITFEVQVTAASGTNPKMQVQLQVSEDSTNWTELTNTKQFTGAGTFRFARFAIGAKWYRWAWVVSGTNPSFTTVIRVTLKSYLPDRSLVISKYQDLKIDQSDAVSSVFISEECHNIGVTTVRSDDGGSSCQYKIQASTNGQDWAEVTGNVSQARATTLLTSFSDNSFRYFRLKIFATANVTNYLDIFWSGGD